MQINESAENLLYQTYKNAGPSLTLILPALFINSISIPGMALNAFVVFCTIYTKSLHGTANFLLALISSFDFVHQSGHLIFLFIVATGINFVTSIQAVRLELPMIFGSYASIFCMVSAAFDRLFTILAPHKHRSMNKPLYLSIHLVLCICYASYNTLSVYFYYSQNEGNSPTTGCISEILSGPIGEEYFKHIASLIASSTFLYLFVWLTIRCKNVSKETQERLVKSLVVILAINVGGYFLSLGTYQILFHLPSNTFDPIRVWQLGFISGIIVNCCSASNAVVLYLNSTEYRKAFKMNLGKMAKMMKWQSNGSQGSNWVQSVHVVGGQQINNNNRKNAINTNSD